MIKLESLNKIYRRRAVETTALNQVRLDIAEAEFLAVMGPSGSGKSTLLNILGMLDQPTSGAYRFLGQDIAGASERHLTDLRKQHLSFVFQDFNLLDELTVSENVELPLIYRPISARERREQTREVLELVHLGNRSEHYPQELSGGQQQRVAVARALVTTPRLILADEPTGNLDSANGREVMGLLQTLNQGGTAIIMVTHSPTHARYAHRIVHLFDGRIVEQEHLA